MYTRQFDAVRAIAVILVILWHWFPHGTFGVLPLGNMGVDIFFVLSGFLITRILLEKKHSIESGILAETKVTAIGKFMMRRSLRIFPIYYLMLFVLIIGAKFLPNPIPRDWEYYVIYGQNFLYYVRQSLPGGKVSPFWSLAVEEQFYLIWPWLLLFVPSKFLRYVLLAGFVLGATCYLIFPLVTPKNELTEVLPFTCVHAFCAGGLLSFINVYFPDALKAKAYPFAKVLGLIAIGAYTLIKIFFIEFSHLDRTLVSIITTWLLTAILTGNMGLLTGILSNNILVSLGKVSYGIYVYHNFVPVSVTACLKKMMTKFQSGLLFDLAASIEQYPLLFHTVCLGLLLIVSFSSYYFIEQRFLSLKKYFE